MKKFVALVALLLAIWVVLNHDRIYLHDFFAKVEIGGKADPHDKVYINSANDVLLISDDRPPTLQLVRQSGAAPVLAGSINCIYGLACLVHKQDATALAGMSASVDPSVVKGANGISFRTADGKTAVVHLK